MKITNENNNTESCSPWLEVFENKTKVTISARKKDEIITAIWKTKNIGANKSATSYGVDKIVKTLKDIKLIITNAHI